MFLLRNSVRLLTSNSKVSSRGSHDALFLELLDEIRASRLDKDPEVHRRPSDDIVRLTQEETNITRKLFHRLSEGSTSAEEQEAAREHRIDPYWDPYEKVKEGREKLVADFNEFSALVTASEAKRARIQIKKSLMDHQKKYDNYSAKFRKSLGRSSDTQIPQPHRIMEQFWERSALQAQLNQQKITWRDADLLQHFRAPNGYILPRRSTMLSKQKQREMSRAMKIAQHMAIVPIKCNAKNYQAVPLMDPTQWMVDRLTRRFSLCSLTQQEKDSLVASELDSKISAQRAEAMLKVLMTQLAPNLNYTEFIKLKQKNSING